MSAIVIVVAVVAGMATLAWFLFGRTPERTATHDTEPLPRDRAAARDLSSPADAGAEDMSA